MDRTGVQEEASALLQQEEEETPTVMDEEEEEITLMQEVFVYKGGNQVVPANVTRVKAHKSCKRIEKEAFVGRIFLQDVDCSQARFEAILEGAFRGCEGLRSFITPPTTKTIGDKAFSGCLNLRHVRLNDRLEKIGRDAFKQCNLEYAALPKNLKWLNSGAFTDCLNLTNVALQAAIKTELKGTFKGCNSLEKIGKHRNVKLGKGCIPPTVQDSITIDGNYKEFWKEVNQKNEEVYQEIMGYRQAERNVREMMDVKPSVESLVAGEGTLTETANSACSKKEFDEMAEKLQQTAEERDTLLAQKEQLANECDNKMKSLQAEKDETEAKMKELQAEKDQLEQEDKAKMVALQAEKELLAQTSNARINELNVGMEALKAANLKLEQEKESMLLAKTEMDTKLQDAITEKTGIMERLHMVTGDCRALKAENERLLKEKQDKEELLLTSVGKCGALEERSKRLEAQNKRLRELRHGGHESVISYDDDGDNGLEGKSIDLDGERSRTEKSKLSSVTGEDEEEEPKRPSRKRKLRRSTEEKSRKYAQRDPMAQMRQVERMMEVADEMRKSLEASKIAETSEKAAAKK